METRAENLQEAINHFLNNNIPVSCYSKKRKQLCNSLNEANEFFNNKPKKVRNKVRPITKKQFFWLFGVVASAFYE